ncbi:MAG: metallophosphoesterase [Clostridia bacterium]|nr:metallophosphoesterase [Clostridia bacterium]
MFLKSAFLRVTAALLTAVMLLYVGVSEHTPYDVEKPDECLLNFAVLSDVHIESNNLPRYRVFTQALQDLRKAQSGHDAILFLGDNTMNGQVFENLLFHGGVQWFLRSEKVLPVMGNHDIGNGQGNYDRLQRRWLDFTESFFGKRLTSPYYAEVIDGYTFVVLGMQQQRVYEMYMSDAQFLWLEGVLADAAERSKPVFVFSHYPTDCVIDGEGNETDRLTNLFAQYSREHDIFCFVGHTHMPLYLFWSFHTYDGFPETYLPRLTELTGVDNEPYKDTGIGVEVEVYDGELVIRGRDFLRGEWKYEQDGAVPCEVRYPLRDAA